MERASRPQRVRLQLLRAVRAPTAGDRQITVLLKYVIAPEYALNGTTMDTIYGCPLSHFYQSFIGISRDVLRDRTEPSFTRGNAVHAGYRRAADARMSDATADQLRDAYLDGVRRSWSSDFAYLLLDRPKRGPKKLHRAPVEAASDVIALCEESWPDGSQSGPELLQERLVHSATRGLAGRIDRLERDGKTITLTEVKTGGSFGAELDRVTGKRHAGGIQALAYREVIQSRDPAARPTAVIEELDESGATRLPLASHPVLTRAGATLSHEDERTLDLWAQSRNVGYIAATGLMTGYDATGWTPSRARTGIWAATRVISISIARWRRARSARSAAGAFASRIGPRCRRRSSTSSASRRRSSLPTGPGSTASCKPRIVPAASGSTTWQPRRLTRSRTKA